MSFVRSIRKLIIVIIMLVITLSPAIAALLGILIVEFLRRDVNHIMKY